MAKIIPKLLLILKGIFIILCILVPLGTLIYHQDNLIEIMHQTNYVIEVEKCQKNANIYMLVLVGSHPDHIDIRDAIRKAWGNPRLKNYKFKLVFLFGKVANTTQQDQLQKEHNKYGDILEGTFVDSFHNITMRDLMGLHWAAQQCQQAKYILRADDDIALDIYKIIRNLDTYYNNVSDLIACFRIMQNGGPQRSGRYAISEEDYPYSVYDDYCEGWAYLVTPLVAHKIVQMDALRKTIWPNDIYIAGLLIKALGLRHRSLHLLYTYSYEDVAEFAQTYDKNSIRPFPFDIGPLYQNATLLLQMHEIYKTRAIYNGFIFEDSR